MGSKIILNGGLEQGIMERALANGELSDADKKHFEYLKSLPQNRAEVDGKIIASHTIIGGLQIHE